MTHRGFALLALLTPICMGLGGAPGRALGGVQRSDDAIDREVIATERGALDRWIKGDPDGYLEIYADDITYFDPGQERRIDGLPAMRAYLTPIRGKVKIPRYEMLDAKVQHSGDIAVLSYRIVNYELRDGTEHPTTRWNSTAVFRRTGGKWRTIHSHFSFTKPELKQ